MWAIDAFVHVLEGTRERRRRRVADAELAEALPLAVDLVAVAVGAGASFLQALDLAARWAPEVAAQRFEAVRQRVVLGAALPDALSAELSVAPALAPFVTAVVPALRLGAPLAPLLRTVGTEMRAAQVRAAMTRARAVSVRLIFPLVVLVLPAFALLTVVPALVAGWRSI